jgi:hypothetical protein
MRRGVPTRFEFRLKCEARCARQPGQRCLRRVGDGHGFAEPFDLADQPVELVLRAVPPRRPVGAKFA